MKRRPGARGSLAATGRLALRLAKASASLSTNEQNTLLLVLLVFLLGLVVRTLATAILDSPGDAFAWLTPGAQMGLLLASVGLAVAIALPATARLMLAALALMAGAILVNLAPPNPYSAAALAVWRQGHFLNFNGLTRLSASIWPFLVLPYMTWLGRRL